ncbi:MAG: hypothetical protein K9J06_04575 [Flavobacteriales bacterium]|nr:hypothetical protein [Flavobacteriales bacterium]
MKTLIILLTALLFAGTADAQKKAKLKLDYDKESGIVSNEGELLFKVVEERSAHLPSAKDYTIQSMEGKNLLMLVYNDFYDSRKASQSNPKGRVIYYDVAFFNEAKDRAEVGYNLFMGMMKMIYNGNLIVGGELNKEAVEVFMMKNGQRKFSTQRETAR